MRLCPAKLKQIAMAKEKDLARSIIFREESRFWIQRVVVPFLVLIGAASNIISIIILTRRKMRSSTNAYLTGLAVADFIYLLFVFVLSFKHYPNINDRRYELYWRFYGISHWLCDAASSTSVWLTVSFTLERYIVVCHPIKGKVLCTERRAKCIIAIVSVLCIMTTITTSFEHQLLLEETCVKVCDEGDLKSMQPDRADEIKRNDELSVLYGHSVEMTDPPSTEECNDEFYAPSYEIIPMNRESAYVFTNTTSLILDTLINIALMNTTCCIKNYTVSTEDTNLGKNPIYQKVFYWFSSIFFGVLPLALIATFNCFLVCAVYKSHKKRDLMTNSQEKKSLTQENRITLLLIAVVVLFLICQIPTSSFLIYVALAETDLDDEYTENIKTGLGNIFNSLLTLNAACNFMLYCLLSEKYRRTFTQLFLRRKLEQESLRHASLRLTNRKLLKRGMSDFARTPRNLEAQSLNSIPRSKSLMQRPLGKANSRDLIV